MSGYATVKSGSHWYAPDGSPRHQIEKKSSKTGEMRNTTLRDARKFGWYPSVTTILSMMDKPMLNAWRVDQALAAFHDKVVGDQQRLLEWETNPDQAKKKLAMESETITRESARFGSAVHDAIHEFVVNGRDPRTDLTLRPWMDKFMDWWNREVEDVVWTEKTLVGLGYVGTCDIKFKLRGIDGYVIGDWKTRKRDSRGKFGIYDENAMQLAAYRKADLMAIDEDPNHLEPITERIVSILINSNEPEEPEVHAWSVEDCERYWQAFEAIRHAWTWIKNYDPCAPNFQPVRR